MGSIGASLAAALVLALGAGGTRAAAVQSAAVGRVVSVRAVPPPPPPPGAPVPVAGGATARPEAPAPTARSAAARGATISGFAFHPGSITVTVGDTISWTNEDSASHTVTANDGSFDTGTLAKGASDSHTFTTAGTFAYHCAIHPTMHGTVTVVAAASGGGSSTDSTGAAGGGSPAAGGSAATPSSTPAPSAAAATPSSTATATPGTLPRTGWNPAAVAAAGAALLLAGLALRVRTRSH